MSKYFTIGVITITLLLFPLASFGTDGKATRVPKGCSDASLSCEESDIVNNNMSLYSRYPLNIFMRIYRAISRVDGNRCSMYPTCSHYAIEAREKHGLLMGIVMTFDRLIHEGNEMDYAPLVEVDDSLRYADPVENNDFWWSH
jgi:hypothetical protein